MDWKFVESLEDHLKKLSLSFFPLKSFFCHFKVFYSEGASWKERQALRRRLVQKLAYQAIREPVFKRWNSKKLKYSLQENPLFDLSEREAFKQDTLKQNKGKFLKVLLQPAESLITPFATISIAHCPKLGGFIFSFDNRFSLGFDMELSYRPTQKLLSRVSKEKELNEAPLPSLLWTAKEAAFKCANQALIPKPQFLKHCLISGWRQIKKRAYQFDFHRENHKEIQGRGIAFSKGHLTVAVASINQSF